MTAFDCTIDGETLVCTTCGRPASCADERRNCHGVQPPRTVGPGEWLTWLTNRLQVPKPENCQCRERAKQMDKWGAEGCREHREEIIGWLKENAAGLTNRDKLAIYWRARKLGIGISVVDPFGSVVDEAIRRAAEREPG